MLRAFKKDLGSLGPLFEFTSRFAADQRLDDAAAFAMNLVVEELFTNMVKYGGGSADISLALDVRDGTLVIELVHPGAAPFDPTRAGEVDVTRPLEERQPGGIGLHLVRSLMDDVQYDYAGSTARITLTRRLGGH